MTSDDLAARLLELAALELIGKEAEPISFCRSANAVAHDEYRIVPTESLSTTP